jgi:asparagine synthase (glutamine-hydrolysing)
MSSVPLYVAMAEIAREKGIVVLLLGEGADELFMGYGSYLSLIHEPQPSAVGFYLSPDRRRLASRLLGKDAVDEVTTGWMSAMGTRGSDLVANSIRSFELEHSLEPLLRRADHALMSVAIEGRTPFLHGAVPATAAALPVASLLDGGLTKAALRVAYGDSLPGGHSRSSKRPFRAPIQSWLADPLRPLLETTLARNRDALSSCGVDPDACGQVVVELERGSADAANLAYCLLTLCLWLEWLSVLQA